MIFMLLKRKQVQRSAVLQEIHDVMGHSYPASCMPDARRVISVNALYCHRVVTELTYFA